MKKRFESFLSLGIVPSDSPEVAVWKRIFTGAAFFGIFNISAFGTVMWIFDALLTAAGMFLYALINLVSLPIFLVTKKFTWFRNLHLGLLAIMPGVYTITLGGIFQSGLFLIWCIMMPLAALTGGPRKDARRWAIFSGIVIILTVIAIQITPAFDEPPVLLSNVLGAMNILSIGIFVFVMFNSFVFQRDTLREKLNLEKARSEALLLNVLPASIAERLQKGEAAIADRFDEVSILFADMVGFTALSERMDAAEVVSLLNDLFTRFDKLTEANRLEKIRTIGDAYMVVAGAPTPRSDHATLIVKLALGFADELVAFRKEKNLDINFRIGINSGSVIGAIIGKSKFHYDVWGDAVNLAARMESHGVPGRIQITTRTKNLLGGKFNCEARGKIEVKGKGLVEAWLIAPSSALSSTGS